MTNPQSGLKAPLRSGIVLVLMILLAGFGHK
jgi:hypothetical protein